jgi:hypothetical protein
MMHDSNSINPRDLIMTVKILATDVDESERQMQATGSDLLKRHFVRAVFAWIEALSYLFRQVALSKIADGPFTPEKMPTLLALQERTFAINDKGEVKSTPQKASTSSLLLFSLKSFAASQGLPLLDIDKGGRNWQFYVQALTIRDRLTHPKNPNDVYLSDQDIVTVQEAKGMMLAYLELLLNPDVIAVLNAHSDFAKAVGQEITLTFSGENLEYFSY